MSNEPTNDTNEPSPASAGSQGAGVAALLEDIGACLAQIDPFDQRCVVVLNTPERTKAHKALWKLKKMESFRITKGEREAIEVSRRCLLPCQDDFDATLRGLLERLG